jgi:hypothetical protein
MATEWIAHRTSLALFPIFCKQLPTELFSKEIPAQAFLRTAFIQKQIAQGPRGMTGARERDGELDR